MQGQEKPARALHRNTTIIIKQVCQARAIERRARLLTCLNSRTSEMTMFAF